MANPCGTFNETYAQDIAIVRTRTQWALLIGGLMLLFAMPLFTPSFILTILISVGTVIITVVGLQIVTGYCGQISIGQAAFMAVGAFAGALLVLKVGLSFWLALPIAGLISGLVGLVFGIPSLRVKGLYLVLATLAAYFIIYFIILRLFEGAKGVMFPAPTLGGFTIATDSSFYYLIMTITCLLTFFAKNIVRTKTGRAFVAIRDNENAAEVMGIDVFRYKLLAFFIACFYAGIAGCLWASYTAVADLMTYSLIESIWYLGMILVGGLGSIAGAIMGVIFIRLVRELSYLISPLVVGAFPSIAGGAAPASELIFIALAILLFIIFEPRGLYHRWEISKTSYRLWPFARI